jgi:hypothetical protein
MRLRDVHASMLIIASMMFFATGLQAQQRPDPGAARGGVTGCGTTNTIPKWTGTSSIRTSVIVQSSAGNIGINTTTRGFK